MKNKKVLSCALAAMMAMQSSGVVFAGECADGSSFDLINKESCKDNSYDEIFARYNVKDVSPSDLPPNVRPMEIKNVNELSNILKDLEAKKSIHFDKKKETNVIQHETYDCASQQVSIAAHINLKANVENDMHSTVFPYYEGKVVSVDPFTEFVGFTYGFEWNENGIGSKISSDGKSFDAWANGQLDYYFLIDGLIKLFSESIDISGTVHVF